LNKNRHTDAKAARSNEKMIQQAINVTTVIALTTDMWTKKGLTESYMTVSGAFYNETMGTAQHAMLHLALLPHPHTGEAIGAVIDEVMKEWQIPNAKVGLIITDNGTNMVKAMRCMKGSGTTSTSTSTSGITASTSNRYHKEDEYEDEEDDEGNGNDENYGDDSSAAMSDDNTHNSAEEETDEDEEEVAVLNVPMPMPVNFATLRLPCFPHTLQLTVGDLSKLPEYKGLCSTAKALVAKVIINRFSSYS
jgi:hypothetical protein